MTENAVFNNNMTDIVVLLMPIFVFACIGAWLDMRNERQIKLLKDLVRYTSELQENVNGNKLDLPTFNNVFEQTASNTFIDVKSGEKSCFISSQLFSQAQLFFDGLHNSSTNALLQHLAAFNLQYTNMLEKLQQKSVVKNLFLKLGVLFGALISILLI